MDSGSLETFLLKTLPVGSLRILGLAFPLVSLQCLKEKACIWAQPALYFPTGLVIINVGIQEMAELMISLKISVHETEGTAACTSRLRVTVRCGPSSRGTVSVLIMAPGLSPLLPAEPGAISFPRSRSAGPKHLHQGGGEDPELPPWPQPHMHDSVVPRILVPQRTDKRG